jgi:hypothetical protein
MGSGISDFLRNHPEQFDYRRLWPVGSSTDKKIQEARNAFMQEVSNYYQTQDLSFASDLQGLSEKAKVAKLEPAFAALFSSVRPPRPEVISDNFKRAASTLISLLARGAGAEHKAETLQRALLGLSFIAVGVLVMYWAHKTGSYPTHATPITVAALTCPFIFSIGLMVLAFAGCAREKWRSASTEKKRVSEQIEQGDVSVQDVWEFGAKLHRAISNARQAKEMATRALMHGEPGAGILAPSNLLSTDRKIAAARQQFLTPLNEWPQRVSASLCDHLPTDLTEYTIMPLLEGSSVESITEEAEELLVALAPAHGKTERLSWMAAVAFLLFCIGMAAWMIYLGVQRSSFPVGFFASCPFIFLMIFPGVSLVNDAFPPEKGMSTIGWKKAREQRDAFFEEIERNLGEMPTDVVSELQQALDSARSRVEGV